MTKDELIELLGPYSGSMDIWIESMEENNTIISEAIRVFKGEDFNDNSVIFISTEAED